MPTTKRAARQPGRDFAFVALGMTPAQLAQDAELRERLRKSTVSDVHRHGPQLRIRFVEPNDNGRRGALFAVTERHYDCGCDCRAEKYERRALKLKGLEI